MEWIIDILLGVGIVFFILFSFIVFVNYKNKK